LIATPWKQIETAGARLIDAEEPQARRRRLPDLTVWSLHLLIAIIVTLRHEMWRDELQAWAIARESTWPWDVVANTRFEGHPPTWHLLLWLGTHITSDPWMAHLISLACMATAAWLVLMYLPATLPIRALIIFGYYPLYEMGVFARSYGLVFVLTAAVLAISFGAARSEGGLRLGWVVVLLVLLATTAAQAVPLAGALALGVGIRHYRTLAPLRTAAAGAAVLAAGTASLLWSRPPRGTRNLDIPVVDSDQIRRVLSGPVRVAWPLFEHVGTFWNQYITHDLGGLERWFGGAVLVVVAVVVRRTRPALVTWLLGAGGFLLLTQGAKLPMQARQLTVLWVVLFATGWMVARDRLDQRDNHGADATVAVADVVVADVARRFVVRAGVALILLGSAVGAVWPVAVDVRFPFSGGQGAAAWIRTHSDQTPAILCATGAPFCSSVAIRLGEPAYMRADSDPFTYVIWRRGQVRRAIPAADVVGEARRLEVRLRRPVAIVSRFDNVPPGCEDGWTSPPTIEFTERFVVCFADQLTEGGTPP